MRNGRCQKCNSSSIPGLFQSDNFVPEYFCFVCFSIEMLKSPSQKKAHDEQLHLNVKSESSYTPLHQAAIAGDDAAVEVLLVSGASRFAADNKVQSIEFGLSFSFYSLNDFHYCQFNFLFSSLPAW